MAEDDFDAEALFERGPLDSLAAAAAGDDITGLAFRRLLADLAVEAGSAMTSGRCALDTAERLILAGIELRYPSRSSRAKARSEIGRFFHYARARGLEWLDEIRDDHVEEWVWTATKRTRGFTDVRATTAANRQAFVRLAFEIGRSLGLGCSPEIAGPAIARGAGRRARPLTELEHARLRAVAYGGLLVGVRPIIVALTEAGGRPHEIAAVTRVDLDLDAGVVHLPGRHARTGKIPTWALGPVRDAVNAADLEAESRVVAHDRLPVERAAHSVVVQLRRALELAGLGSTAGVTPTSIRLTIAHQVFTAEGIFAAAKYLGNSSLDDTAAALGIDLR